MNKELAVLLTMKKKFQGLINTFVDILNSSSETNYYINSFKTNDNSKLNNFIDAIYDHFEVDKILVEEEIKLFGSSVKDYYNYAITKYNVRRVAPKKRGRPKKINV